jgi:hypothetical protein
MIEPFAQNQAAIFRAVAERSAPQADPLMRSLIEASQQNQALILRSMLEQSTAAPQDGSASLVRGIELAKEMFRSNAAAAAPPAQSPQQAEDEIASIFGSVLRMMAPAAAVVAAAPAPPPAPPPAPSGPPMITSPGLPPPGCSWMLSSAGWSLIATPEATPPPSPPAPPPAPVAHASSGGAVGGADVEAHVLSMLLADPMKRERLLAALGLGAPAAAQVHHAPPAVISSAPAPAASNVDAFHPAPAQSIPSAAPANAQPAPGVVHAPVAVQSAPPVAPMPYILETPRDAAMPAIAAALAQHRPVTVEGTPPLGKHEVQAHAMPAHPPRDAPPPPLGAVTSQEFSDALADPLVQNFLSGLMAMTGGTALSPPQP